MVLHCKSICSICENLKLICITKPKNIYNGVYLTLCCNIRIKCNEPKQMVTFSLKNNSLETEKTPNPNACKSRSIKFKKQNSRSSSD